ncbi:MAG: hypothetical protein PHI35_04880 [Victivallaceae bacterium]|nr:hypothetical protein [Victivallaceae bacterium]
MPESLPFTRSAAAQGAAMTAISAARQLEIFDSALTVDPALAEAEKHLLVQLLKQVHAHGSLSHDEMASLFTFVYAKAAEAATGLFNGKIGDFEMTGVFDGKASIAADERLIGIFKQRCDFPALCAENFIDWAATEPAVRNCPDPMLPLFEALKWVFRISCHFAITQLQSR